MVFSVITTWQSWGPVFRPPLTHSPSPMAAVFLPCKIQRDQIIQINWNVCADKEQLGESMGSYFRKWAPPLSSGEAKLS